MFVINKLKIKGNSKDHVCEGPSCREVSREFEPDYEVQIRTSITFLYHLHVYSYFCCYLVLARCGCKAFSLRCLR